MTVQSVGSGSNQLQYMNAAEQAVGPGGQLAALILSTEQSEQTSEHQELELARASFKRELDAEVASMHEAANRAMCGAITQGALTAAGGALTITGAMDRCPTKPTEPTYLEHAGDVLTRLAQPTGTIVSGSDGQHALAEAKAHAGKGEQAKWVMDDAHERVEQSNERVDRTVDWVSGLADKAAAASSAVLGNMA